MPLFVKHRIPIDCVQQSEDFEVQTIEGTMKGKAGDWLARGIKGEFYPIAADIFAETYEPFVEPPSPPEGWIAARVRRPIDIVVSRQRLEAIKSRLAEVPKGPWAVVGDPWDRRRTAVVSRPKGKYRYAPAGDPHISPLVVDCDNAFAATDEDLDDEGAKDRAIANYIAHSWSDIQFLTNLLEQILTVPESTAQLR